jgi:hypothetical protein
MITPRIAKSGACANISLRGADAVAANSDAGKEKFMTSALRPST